MLRSERRWHDAVNSPPNDGEARLLWFASNPPPPGTPSPGTPGNPNNQPETPEQAEANRLEQERRQREQEAAEAITVEQKLQRRQAEQALMNGEHAPEESDVPAAKDVLARVNALHKRLKSMKDTTEEMTETAQHLKDAHGHAPVAEVKAVGTVVDGLWDAIETVALPIQALKLDKWESGKMTPYEFLHHLATYNEQMDELDQEQMHQEATNTLDVNARMTPVQCQKRKQARDYLYEQAKKAVEDCKKRKPEHFSEEQILNVQPLTPQQIWDLYNEQEKKDIINTISKAAGVDLIKVNAEDDISAITQSLEKPVSKEKKPIEEMILIYQRKLLELKNNHDDTSHGSAMSGGEGGGHGGGIMDVVSTVQTAFNSMNQSLGIEWLTLYELKAAFDEVIESIKEVRKRGSASRIARAALAMGRVASFIPGCGGDDLVNVLDELLDHKNNEIKDAYKKELASSREDLGFKDLFIGGHGGISRMQYYMNLGDTNRSRAILEFAADKALLYGIEDKTPDTYMIPPKRYTLRQVLPPEWSNHQVGQYFDNLRYANNQGQKKQVEAGENLVKGRDTLAGYLDPFKGILNSMSLWLAKGVAEAALKKIKKGEMAASLTLIVLDAWEHNPLFREYVPMEYLARFSGDHKQLLVGMLKYDQGHLIAGAQEPGYETLDLEKARVKPRPGEEAPEPRLGPYVAAVRRYVDDNLPGLKENDPQKYFSIVAKLLASQTVEEGGKTLTIYSDAIMPYHIKYKPDEMREANVEALGDDNFVERSEIINTTVEVMKAIGFVDQNGFKHNMKGRYFFSQIIDNYSELVEKSNKLRTAGKTAEANELLKASENFKNKLNPQIDLWIEDAMNAGGANKILKVLHKDQRRYLLLTLLQKGLLSISKVQELADKRPAAQELLDQYEGVTERSPRNNAAGSGSANPAGATAA